MSPRNPYGYLQARGEGNKGASYKYTWRPDWRVPPGVSQWKVLLQVAALCAIAAIPVYGLPFVSKPKDEEQQKYQDMYMRMKQKNRDERLKWIQSDSMPYK